MRKFKKRNLLSSSNDEAIKKAKKLIYFGENDHETTIHKFNNGYLIQFKYKGYLYLVFDDEKMGWSLNGISGILKMHINNFTRMVSEAGALVEVTLHRKPYKFFPESRVYKLVTQDFINSIALQSKRKELQILKEFTQHKVNKVIEE